MLLTHLNVGDHVKLGRIARRSSYVSYALVPTASAIVDAADILVRQDVRDVGDVVITAPPGCPNLPQRSVIVCVGPTSADFRGGLCYLDAVEPEQARTILCGGRGAPSAHVGSDKSGSRQIYLFRSGGPDR